MNYHLLYAVIIFFFPFQVDHDLLLRSFLVDLHNPGVPAKQVVEKYLLIELDAKNNLGLNERVNNAIEHIKQIREEQGNLKNWLLPAKPTLGDTIVPYEEVPDQPLQLNGIKKGDIVYTLVNERKQVKQYFLVKEGRVWSFSMIVKPENEGFFFTY